MKKIVPFLVIIWVLIGIASFFIWWKVTRNLTPEILSNHANKIAKELEVPWEMKFKKITPSYGADFRIIFDGLEAIASDGTSILKVDYTEVRLPWTILFSRNPVRVNVNFNDVVIADWSRILTEIELFLDQRKTDRVQEISVAPQLVASSVNLRLNNVQGMWKDSNIILKKVYLLNMDPKKPTAFEVVFPWETNWKGASLSGETKILGEYRFSSQKIDLHYYLKSRLQTQRDARIRASEVSVEGKGFYHPRMGLFTTLSAKDDWVAFVGDAEWTTSQFKLNVPKFALSKDFVIELLPLTGLHGATTPYQTTALLGELRWLHSDTEKDFKLSVRSKSSAKWTQPTKPDRSFSLSADISSSKPSNIEFKLGDVSLFNYQHSKKESSLSWSEELFAPIENKAWYQPHNEIWDMAWFLPWDKLVISSGDKPAYQLARGKNDMRVSSFEANEAWPPLDVTHQYSGQTPIGWEFVFDKKSLEEVLLGMGLESFLVPGHLYTGAIQVVSGSETKFKLAWKGGGIALVSRSSCKTTLSEKAETAQLLNKVMAHQAELSLKNGEFNIVNWQAKDASETWTIKGVWSNSPVKCLLNFNHKIGKAKPSQFSIDLNQGTP